MLTTVAMVIGLVVVNIVKPGSGLHIDLSTLSTKGLPPEATTAHEGFAEFLLAVIPATLVSALTGNEILPVLLVSALFGFGLHASGEAGLSIARGVEKFSTVLFTLIRWFCSRASAWCSSRMNETDTSWPSRALSARNWRASYWERISARTSSDTVPSSARATASAVMPSATRASVTPPSRPHTGAR